MKKFINILITMCMSLTAYAGVEKDIFAGEVDVSDIKMENSDNYVIVDMLLNFQDLKVNHNRAVILTPVLTNGMDSVCLPSVGIYGRSRYYYYLRNGENLFSDNGGEAFKASLCPDNLKYHQTIPYSDWMEGAALELRRRDYGCCNTELVENTTLLAFLPKVMNSEAWFPELVYVTPTADKVKSRELEGVAFIDFPVNKTEIYPDYRRNIIELAKIQATIDSVRSDSDVTITQVWLKGYASPESPYSHNEKLAVGRTDALKDYIRKLYSFDNGIIATDHEAEDWTGLRKYVSQSDIEHKEEILALIDSDMAPDAKELKIKRKYPREYKLLLENCYPSLRHTDYRIAYNIRSFTDPSEIVRVMGEAPQKLDLNEFYLAANQYEPGSDEFTDIFETAVRMFPTDATANLNAANASMRKGDQDAARKYLNKAGDTAESTYARGVLAVLERDFGAAVQYFEIARNMGLEKAAETLKEMEENGLLRN